MTLVRGRAEARWMPSRYRYALFRLGAYVRLRFAKPQRADDVAFAIDRDQSAIESYSIAAWIVLTVTCFLSAGPFSSWPLPLALPVSLLLTPVLMHIPICTFGLGLPNRNNIRLTSIVTLLMVIAAALYYARSESWARFAAWQFLAVLAINGLAAMIVFALRGPMAKLEATFAA